MLLPPIQSNIIHALNKKKLWNIDDHRSIRIHKIIGKLITLDIQPFSIVEDTIIHFPQNHTGVHIKEYLQKGLESFEIPLSKIHLIVTDNANNMKAAVKNSGMA